MLVLLDTSEPLDQAAAELGLEVGQLLTPLTRFADRGGKYGIDNGAFAGFNRSAFASLLERQKQAKDRCLWVAVPDVVGDARRTLEVFDMLYPTLSTWPLALVAQDGIEDLPIPWKLIRAAVGVIKAAQILGCWVHVGRVNTPERFDRFADLGVDSIDGTGISRYTHMRRELAAPMLWSEGEGR